MSKDYKLIRYEDCLPCSISEKSTICVDEAMSIHYLNKPQTSTIKPDLFYVDLHDRSLRKSFDSFQGCDFVSLIENDYQLKTKTSYPETIVDIKKGIAVPRLNTYHYSSLAFGKESCLYSVNIVRIANRLFNTGKAILHKDSITLNPCFKPDMHINGTAFAVRGSRSMMFQLCSFLTLVMLKEHEDKILDNGEPFYLLTSFSSPDMLVLLKEFAKSIRGFDKLNIIDIGFLTVSADRLLLPSSYFVSHYQAPGPSFKEVIKRLRLWANKYYKKNQSYYETLGFPELPKKIFVSRQDAKWRYIENEEEIFSKLKEYGYQSICPGKFSFVDQLVLFSQAKCVIGQHGMGLSNIVFCPKGAKVAEIFTPYLARTNYRMHTKLLDMEYGSFLFEPKSEPLNTGNVYIPPEIFFETLDKHGFLD